MKRCYSLLLLSALSVMWLQADVKTYLKKSQMPDAVEFLPVPPDSVFMLMSGDYGRYWWGKSLRASERGERARQDAQCNPDYFCRIFSEAMGMTLSKEATPEIYELLERAVQTIDKSDHHAKDHYMRRRPYMVFAEPTLVPGDEERLSKNGSYPSGHTVCGWSCALLLAEINPEAANQIFKTGYEYGQSRVIAGFHWQSDVDAGRVVASAGYAVLHSNDEFMAQMKKAKKEFASKKK